MINNNIYISNYCVLDLETTGLSCIKNEIIEVGILKVRNDEIVEKYSRLVKPKAKVSKKITEITGITNVMLDNMPSIEDIIIEILQFIGDDVIIGHNILFDLGFISSVIEMDLPNEYLDTVYLSKNTYPELKRYRLSDLTNYLGIYTNTHRAIDDCIATKELYDDIKKRSNNGR